jgi:hypothetical protein
MCLPISFASESSHARITQRFWHCVSALSSRCRRTKVSSSLWLMCADSSSAAILGTNSNRCRWTRRADPRSQCSTTASRPYWAIGDVSFIDDAHERCRRSLLEECPYAPAIPLLTRTLTSTRRFSARPAFVSFGATGPYSPIAPGATICRTGTPPCCIK